MFTVSAAAALAGVVGLNLVTVPLRGASSMAMIVDGFLAVLPSWLAMDGGASGFDGVWAGYAFADSVANPPYFVASLVYNGTLTGANASLQPLYDFLAENAADFYVDKLNLTAYSSFVDWHDATDDAATGDRTGANTVLGSRLVPLAVAVDVSRRALLTSAIVNASYVLPPVELNVVAGGAVAGASPLLLLAAFPSLSLAPTL
jgi:hypothetical protein